MEFALIVILSLVVLGIIAAVSSIGGDDEPIVKGEGDCTSCTSHDDGSCKIAALMDEARKRKAGCGTAAKTLLLLAAMSLLSACTTQKNTSQSRFWHSFHARYNTYFNASQAFVDGCEEKEKEPHDDYTQLLPLYTVANKQDRTVGSGQFDRAIEKSEKAIRRHSIKRRPEWRKKGRKTKADIEWLSRREYNPFLWHAWLLLGKSQFQKGEFEEAAATFGYMARLYQSQPVILARARAWQAKSYVEMGWLYEADDLITKQRRDSIPRQAAADWDYTLADYYLRSGQYPQAVSSLSRAIRHERRRKQRARMWFLMGQVETLQGHRQQAYDAYSHVIRLSPPYQLEFNARIAQTEVMAAADSRGMVSRLRRMARSDNNKDYLDQIYYAIGNIHLSQQDTTAAIQAYEQGNRQATRSGTEKGVLLLRLGHLYWQREQYADARRCYGEAVGLLDQDRPDYRELSLRSEVLDLLVPPMETIHLQDSLQRLARMPEAERNQAIDRVIDELRKREREERLARQEAEAEQAQQTTGTGDGPSLSSGQPSPTAGGTASSTWYFYNPQAVSQGKQRFEQQWGRRPNADNWRRSNLTVVQMERDESDGERDGMPDDPSAATVSAEDRAADGDETSHADSVATAADPHTREYYLAQIPFTDEQRQLSDSLTCDALLQAGILLKDRLDNLSLSARMLTRLVSQYPRYSHNDEAWYHLYLLYARQGRQAEADQALSSMRQHWAASPWTVLLTDPYYEENQRFGQHLEDSLYAATYEAFRNERYQEVAANVRLSASRFPNGENRPKFLFIEGLSMLNDGQPDSCAARMRQVVEAYPQSEVSELAGQIVKGIQQGRRLQGRHLSAADIWRQRQRLDMPADSLPHDTLSTARDVRYAFVLAYQPDSVRQNQLLYNLARYNFTSYLVRNFDIVVEDDGAVGRMVVSGFLSYDEATQYARQLRASGALADELGHCRSLIISEQNLPLLGTAYSYDDYEEFFRQELAPVEVSKRQLLTQPETIVGQPDEDDEEDTDNGDAPDDDPSLPAVTPPPGTYVDFDDDFYY